MRTYNIFDCTAKSGIVMRITGPKWLAHLLAWYLSKATGRMHDYAGTWTNWAGDVL